MRVAGGYVGRIGDDDIEGFAGQRGKPVALDKRTRRECPGVALRYRQRTGDRSTAVTSASRCSQASVTAIAPLPCRDRHAQARPVPSIA